MIPAAPPCLVPPTPTPHFKREWVGFLFWSSVPPLCTLSTATPSLAPKRELEGVSSCLSCPLQRLPPLRPVSTPPACALHQRPWPACRVNAPGLRVTSTPLACVPHQHPRPVRRVNAPSLRAVSTPPPCVLCRCPWPVRCINPSSASPALPASALTPPLGLCQCPLLCKRRVCSLGFPPPLL